MQNNKFSLVTDAKECSGCGACFQVCPKKCIQMKPDSEGFDYPYINNEECVHCGLCLEVCNREFTNNRSNKVYACYTNHEELRLASSSGGIVGELVRNIIQKGGVVYGAKFDKNFMVKHTYAQEETELNKLKCSKYVQSKLGVIFREVKSQLLKGKEVLFVGTGCQIHGLKSFLNKEYDNLFCIDFICHGVPSPSVWRKYLDSFKKEVKEINFRSKSFGWSHYKLYIGFQDGSSYHATVSEDPYLRAFVRDLTLRPSCYACKFKDDNIQGDITVGDFWNLSRIKEFKDDDKGTSMVFVNTSKGEKWFSCIKEALTYLEVDLKEAIECNPSYKNSAYQNPKRKQFFLELDKETDIVKRLNRYTKEGLKYKIYSKIGSILWEK